MKKRTNLEVDATEEVQGEIAETDCDFPVYHPCSKAQEESSCYDEIILQETTEKDPRQADFSSGIASLFLAHYRWHGLHVCERPEQ